MIIFNEFDADRNWGIVFYHQPPQKRIITLCYDYDEYYDDGGDLLRYFLSMPPIVFKLGYQILRDKFQFASLCVAFTNLKLNEIYYPNLFNVGNSLNVCTGHEGYQLQDSLEELLDKIISDFWNFTFTDDIDDNVHMYNQRKSPLKSYKSWQTKTRKNPSWMPKKCLIPVEKHTLVLTKFNKIIKKKEKNE